MPDLFGQQSPPNTLSDNCALSSLLEYSVLAERTRQKAIEVEMCYAHERYRASFPAMCASVHED